MASFDLRWKRSAIKELRSLPRDVIPRIYSAVDSLISDPIPPHSKKLAGTSDSYRIRVGDYRVVYSILQDILVIEVVRVGHRQGIYKR